MRRVLTSIIAVICALLLAAVITDWVHSLSSSETLVRVRSGRIYAIDNFNGEVALWAGRMVDAQPDCDFHETWPVRNAFKTKDLHIQTPTGKDLWFAGFGYTTRHRFPTTNAKSIDPDRVTGYRGIVIPLWFLTFFFAITPAWFVVSTIRRHRRQVAGMCKVCGYDLRASSERCPECGTPC